MLAYLSLEIDNRLSGSSQAAAAVEYTRQNREKHLFAMEWEAAGFWPKGFSFHASDETYKPLKPLATALLPYGIHQFLRDAAARILAVEGIGGFPCRADAGFATVTSTMIIGKNTLLIKRTKQSWN